jgi:hypothetical protein
MTGHMGYYVVFCAWEREWFPCPQTTEYLVDLPLHDYSICLPFPGVQLVLEAASLKYRLCFCTWIFEARLYFLNITIFFPLSFTR